MSDIELVIVIYELITLQVIGTLCYKHSKPHTSSRYTQILGAISHQLQTPLTILHGELELLCNRNPHPEEFATAKKSLARMTECTQAYLRLLHMDRSVERKVRIRCNLSEITQNAADYIEIMGAEHDISVTTDIEEGIVLYGDRSLLQELLLCITHNAVKYRSTNRKSTIHLRLHSRGGALELAVMDNGVGIAVEDMNHIFDEFYRSQHVVSTSGYGLGLAIAKKIAHMHGASITATSTLGEGSTFTVRFVQ